MARYFCGHWTTRQKSDHSLERRFRHKKPWRTHLELELVRQVAADKVGEVSCGPREEEDDGETLAVLILDWKEEGRDRTRRPGQPMNRR